VSDLHRASTALAAGTLVSRITGLVRTIILVAAIGSIGPAGDAFATANQLPNNIFIIIQSGMLTAVIIPQIVQAAAHRDGGNEYISKLFTLATTVFLAGTAIAIVLAPVLVFIYAKGFTPDQLALATAFAYWCLPQILFYGLYALVGETLNAKRIFGPYAWATVVNNIISIIGFVAFIVMFGGNQTAVETWNPEMIAVLGATATSGIVAQAGVLFFFWRRTGLKLRADFRWRGVGLGNVGKLASFTLFMALTMQLSGLVQATVVSEASGPYPSILMMQAAWIVFMLPYSIFATSIGTPYFTQIAEHAAAGRNDEVRLDIGACIRAVSFFIVVSMAGLAAAAVPASRIFTTSTDDAIMAAPVLLAYLVGLLSLSILFIIQRTFYAYDDTKSPLYFTLVQAGVLIAATIVAGFVVPLAHLAAAIALIQSVAITIQVILAIWMLRKRLGPLDMRASTVSLLRYTVAAVPGGLAGWGAFLLLGGETGWTTAEQILGAVGTVIISIVTFCVYIAVLALIRAPELSIARGFLGKLLPNRG
jgi:putative peptidoglycan lipid II flippase